MTVAAIIDRTRALDLTARSLGLTVPTDVSVVLSKALLAQSLRRTLFNAAPCSASTLSALVRTALMFLVDDPEALKEAIEDTIHDLIAMGDILEMRTDSASHSDILLRPAPPSFVARQDGSFIIIGIAGDEITPTHEPPVTHHASGLRSLRTADAKRCRTELLDLGLIELPERLWLHAPAALPAIDLITHWKGRLPVELKPETIEDLEILDTDSPTSFYKGRWTTLNAKHTGIFVARRRQRYGARLWCLAEVKDGMLQRFMDIRARDTRTRDCDEAWRLQAAMDAAAGKPQTVRVWEKGLSAILSFQGPLPAWAARRLSFIGEQVPLPRALLAFEIPKENAENELLWLEEHLWLARNDEGGVA